MSAQVQIPAEQQPALPLRPHTILGACEAIGEDFGISPLWLRIPLAASVLVSPFWSIVAYLALSLVVLASRYAFPDRRSAKLDAVVPASADSADDREELPLAA